MATAVSPERFKILVVDDDEAPRTFLMNYLSGAGFTVWCSISDSAAVETCKLQDFDLVITDWQMPDSEAAATGMDSGEFLVYYLLPKKPETKIIVMSGRGEPEGLPAGIVFLKKPVDVAALIAAVSQILGVSS